MHKREMGKEERRWKEKNEKRKNYEKENNFFLKVKSLGFGDGRKLWFNTKKMINSLIFNGFFVLKIC
jgi:hypothetical protein